MSSLTLLCNCKDMHVLMQSRFLGTILSMQCMGIESLSLDQTTGKTLALRYGGATLHGCLQCDAMLDSQEGQR